MKNKPFDLRESCVVLAAVLLGVLIFEGCVYRPDSVVKIEVGSREPSAVSREPEKDNDTKGGSVTRPTTTTKPADATKPIPLMSDADAAAVEAALKEFTR